MREYTEELKKEYLKDYDGDKLLKVVNKIGGFSTSPESNKTVIYSAIFGKRDKLLDPEIINPNFDYIMFTDNEEFISDVWDIRIVPRTYPKDPTRSARIYKMLPHKFLSEYDVSVWIDGNHIIVGSIEKLVDEYLSNSDLAVYDHSKMKNFGRNCIYNEARFYLKKKQIGVNIRTKDRKKLKKQIRRYREEGYPEENGLIVSSVILRRHNEPDVINFCDKWWKEILYGCKRDQLSFNYVQWLTNFEFDFIEGDARNNTTFKVVKHKGR